MSLGAPHLVSLVRQALAYRKTDGAIIKVGDGTRLSVKAGQPVWAQAGAQTLCTPEKIDLDGLADLERRGVSFARVLRPADQAAS